MASSSGKVILCGEHAVVYGVPALAAGIDRGARALATASDTATLSLGTTRVLATDDSELGRAFRALLTALHASPCEVQVTLELPAGAGLGASAAIAVAVSRAVLEASGKDPVKEPEAVERAALAFESIFHGNPSGIDTAAASRPGCIYFKRGEPPSPVFVHTPLVLGVAIAGPPASTRHMVESVARLKARRPDVVQKALDGVRSIVENAKLCIEAGDHVGLGKLMDLNQMLLAGLHVSTEEIETACRLAREAGALGAKLTGAGGGGAVIALCQDDASSVCRAWEAAGLRSFATRVASQNRETPP